MENVGTEKLRGTVVCLLASFAESLTFKGGSGTGEIRNKKNRWRLRE
jgi:hypothetical protein